MPDNVWAHLPFPKSFSALLCAQCCPAMRLWVCCHQPPLLWPLACGYSSMIWGCSQKSFLCQTCLQIDLWRCFFPTQVRKSLYLANIFLLMMPGQICSWHRLPGPLECFRAWWAHVGHARWPKQHVAGLSRKTAQQWAPAFMGGAALDCPDGRYCSPASDQFAFDKCTRIFDGVD